ncbi:hypothetical protein PINS_up013989 [Pythium insidiosum]|nr:hypothetical protein PINS_up013989 [Pythium insidiosum]
MKKLLPENDIVDLESLASDKKKKAHDAMANGGERKTLDELQREKPSQTGAMPTMPLMQPQPQPQYPMHAGVAPNAMQMQMAMQMQQMNVMMQHMQMHPQQMPHQHGFQHNQAGYPNQGFAYAQQQQQPYHQASTFPHAQQ